MSRGPLVVVTESVWTPVDDACAGPLLALLFAPADRTAPEPAAVAGVPEPCGEPASTALVAS